MHVTHDTPRFFQERKEWHPTAWHSKVSLLHQFGDGVGFDYLVVWLSRLHMWMDGFIHSVVCDIAVLKRMHIAVVSLPPLTVHPMLSDMREVPNDESIERIISLSKSALQDSPGEVS